VAHRSKKKIKTKTGFSNSDVGRYLFGTILLIIIGFMVYFAAWGRRQVGRPDLCPLDGQLAEWTTRRVDGFCDYGHSNLRSASHTWTKRCVDGLKTLGAGDK
jgi:hypothetical protein